MPERKRFAQHCFVARTSVGPRVLGTAVPRNPRPETRDPIRLGVHVPVAGGLVKAARHARSLGCECIQIFVRSARGWRGRTYPQAEIAEFTATLKKARISPVIVHSCYLVNLASPNRDPLKRSVLSVADDMARAVALGSSTVSTHFGHHAGAGPSAGLRTLANSIRLLLSVAPDGMQLLLENTAGRGSDMGSTWEDFARLFDLLDGDRRLGVCFDTCHAHAAGYRLDSARWVGRTLREFDRTLGLSRLRLIHLNDSLGEAGSRMDRHQHIGRGTIGDTGFRAFLRRREIRDRCAILETPIERPGDDRRNLRRAKMLRG
ncbi:MAG: deoxyribonuclease IV [Armatimonadota bacterium]